MLTPYRTPLAVATIEVDGKSFKVHKELLVKDSAYFDKALNGPFLEGETQIIDLGTNADITAEQLGIYVEVLYHSYFDPGYKYRAHTPKQRHVVTCRQALWLWRLADRFLNKRITRIAEEAFSWGMDAYSVSQWEIMYQDPDTTDADLKDLVCHLEDLYQHCGAFHLPQQDRFVVAAASMPMQLLAKYHDGFGAKFGKKVTLRLMRRLRNSSLKRPREQDGSGEASPAVAGNKRRARR